MGRPKKDMLPGEELDKLAEKIMAEAKKRGINDSYFFQTTFERYQMQLEILKKLAKAIREQETLVSKEYVKNRENIVVNPAISEYNKTATAANGTVATLVKIISTVNEGKGSEPGDSMKQFLAM